MEMQSREDWLKWRKSGIGGSDAYILMEQTDWSTPMDLYNDKISDEVGEWEGNFATKLGDEAEPKIRSLFELLEGKSFSPCLVQMDGYPYVIASLDGRTEDKKELSEYKLINKADWDLAKKFKKVPDKYYTQMQHQLMASKADKCWFVCYLFSAFKNARKKPLSSEFLAVVEVLPDLEFQKQLLALETAFWQENVKKKKPPKPSKSEEIEIKGLATDVKKWSAKTRQLSKLNEEIKVLEKKIKDAAEETGSSKALCHGLKLSKISKVGSVDYKKVPELKGVDLEPYRKAGSSYWKITPPKEKK